MNRTHHVLRRAQRGAVLFIALIVLVAMTLAGLGLMRSVDTGVLIAANLAFKQGATQAGDAGIEAGRAWLNTNGGATLYTSQPTTVAGGQGYFANWQSGIDLTGTDPSLTPLDWSTQAVDLGNDAAGNRIRYVIQRLCLEDKAPSDTSCVRSTAAATSSGSTKGAVAAGSGALTAAVTSVFRITARVDGPRNTKSFVQATVY